jgi:hypothetical protein
MQSGDGMLLTWKFKPNDRFQVDTTMHLLQIRRAAGQVDAQDAIQINTISTFTVQEVLSDQSVVLQQRIDAVNFRLDGNAPAAAATTAELLGRFKGATFTLTLGRDGKVRQLDGYAEWLKQLEQQRPGDAQAISQQVPEADLKAAAEEGFALFPDRPLRVGQKWERPFTVSVTPFGTISTRLVYTLQSWQGNRARIAFKHQGSEFKSAEGRGANFQLEERSGTIVFDADVGRLVSMEIKLRFHGRLPAAVMTPAGLVPVDFFQNQTVRIQVRSLR